MLIVKVPGINGLGKTKGCELAGRAILEEIKNIHSNELGKIIDSSLFDLEEIHLDNYNLELTNKLIYENAFEIFEKKTKAIFLGGDHSISYSLTRAFLDNCQNSVKKPCLIVFDAHSDLMPVAKGANKYPTHEEWLRQLIKDGFPVENILLVGVRNMWRDEIIFLKEKGIRIIRIGQLLENFPEMCEVIMEFAFGKELYVSIDIDVIDPAFAPATGYPEIGGLSSSKFVYLTGRISKMKNLRAIDLVEINSEKDKFFENKTIKLGCKILAELC
jgi:agmatinase